jgi:AcrR family transcriptional regulator
MDAAREVFAERGLNDARVADIAERAGASYGSFYHYFDSKEALFREIADDVAAELSAPVEEIILPRGSATPQDRLRQAIALYYDTYSKQAALLGAVEQAARLDDHVRTARRKSQHESTAQVAESIELLQRRGLADPHLDPEVAATALGAMTYRFAELWLADKDIDCDYDVAVDTVTRLFVNALGLGEPANGPSD